MLAGYAPIDVIGIFGGLRTGGLSEDQRIFGGLRCDRLPEVCHYRDMWPDNSALESKLTGPAAIRKGRLRA